MSSNNKISDTLINCPLCSEEYSLKAPPVTLPCGHNLCRDCAVRIRRRNGMIKCPVDNTDKKVHALQINIDFLDFIVLLKEEAIEIPKKRKTGVSQSAQCDTLQTEENYVRELKSLEEKQVTLERIARLLYSTALYSYYSPAPGALTRRINDQDNQ